ncbi:hypothetical protein D1AOALGA4SA_12245 [Olavius algarvensis Delta 1 endosymbiont]|nr:hypothetical protein D1AOALGA4SA_12245 [Olavius algarvensis Delta 1 endosymbiont]
MSQKSWSTDLGFFTGEKLAVLCNLFDSTGSNKLKMRNTALINY